MDASTLLVTQKIISLAKPSASAFFVKNIYNPTVQSDQEINENFQQLQRIDYNGMLFYIYLNELMKASATIAGQVPDPALNAESGEFLQFLYRIANRGPVDDLVDLNFMGVYFKIGIILVANDKTLNRNGYLAHFNYAKRLLDNGYTTIYVFGIGRKAKIAKKIADMLKNRDNRIVKLIPHEYRHVNTSTGFRTNATCVELETY